MHSKNDLIVSYMLKKCVVAGTFVGYLASHVSRSYLLRGGAHMLRPNA